MTKPTTAECIEWLDSENEKGIPYYDIPINKTIRAKLLAADEMARAIDNHFSSIANNPSLSEALTAYRNAGGL